jgi:hypothetical protein
VDDEDENPPELGEAPSPLGEFVQDTAAELTSAATGDATETDQLDDTESAQTEQVDDSGQNEQLDGADSGENEQLGGAQAHEIGDADSVQTDAGCDADAAQTEHSEGKQGDADPLEREVDAVVETGQPPPVAEQEELLAYVRRRGIDSILSDDYENARRYKITEDVVQHAMHEERMRKDANSWIDSLDSRISGLRRRIDQINEDWDARSAAFDAEFELRRSEMEQRHCERRREFEEQWRDAHFLCGFSKASPMLLQLRQVQRNQALSRDFDGALATKAIADRRQAAEEEESRARATRVMRTEWEQLRARQGRAAQLAEEHRVRQHAYMDEARAREIATVQLAIQQIEGRKSGPMPKLVGPAIVRPKPQNNRPTSPETRRNLYAYRTAKEKQPRLSLPGVDVEQCVRPTRAPSQPFRPRTTKRYRACR